MIQSHITYQEQSVVQYNIESLNALYSGLLYLCILFFKTKILNMIKHVNDIE